MRGLIVLAAMLGGCVKAELVECDDGRTCPLGTVCDLENATCVAEHGLSLPEDPLDFAAIGCGTTADRMLVLKNLGSEAVDFDVSTTVKGVTTVPSSGTVPAGGMLELTVTADPGPMSLAGVTVSGTLVISTKFEQLERGVQFTTAGAIASTDKSTIDFGETSQNGQVQIPFVVRNSGNVDLGVELQGLAAPFSVVGPTTLQVAPNTGQMFTLRFAPASIADYNATAQLKYTGNLCQAATTSLPVVGIASGDALLVDHTVLDFGTSACGVAASTLQLSMTNNLAVAQTVDVAIAGSSYTTPNATVSVSSLGSRSIDVTRPAIPIPHPVGPVTSMLTLTGDVPPTKTVMLTSNVVGAVLQLENDSVDFGMVPPLSITTRHVFMRNSGNGQAAVTLSPAVQTLPSARITLSPSAFLLAPLASQDITVTVMATGLLGAFGAAPIRSNTPNTCGIPPSLRVVGSVGP